MTLLHYTSADAALAILQTGVLHATMVHYMNAAREFQHALDLAREIVESELRNTEDPEESIAVCNEIIERVRSLTVFAVSFSAKDDDLSQWRAYCPRDGGHALEFDSELLRESAEHAGFSLRKCIYDRKEQIEALLPTIKALIASIASTAISEWATGRERFEEQIALVGAQLKDPAFKDEAEWRLIAGPSASHVVKYRSNRAMIVPYVEYSVTVSNGPLKGMLLGPHRHPELAAKSVRHLTASKYGWPFKVRVSPIPFRSLE
jgi:hypothetical protein